MIHCHIDVEGSDVVDTDQQRKGFLSPYKFEAAGMCRMWRRSSSSSDIARNAVHPLRGQSRPLLLLHLFAFSAVLVMPSIRFIAAFTQPSTPQPFLPGLAVGKAPSQAITRQQPPEGCATRPSFTFHSGRKRGDRPCLDAALSTRKQASQDVGGASKIIGPATRASFLSLSLATVGWTFSVAAPAFAASEDLKKKGTKQDPAFEACISQCMYECTKPKGIEQKSRAECLPECKQQCATTKQQLMKGVPLTTE
jgi:hypothetical protein